MKSSILYPLKGEFKNIKTFSGIKLFFFLTLFFPSITFGLLSSEIFPWVLIVSIFYFRKFSFDFVYLIYFFVLSSLFSLLINGETDVFRSLASYLNPLFAFAFVNSLSDEDIL